MKIGITCYPTVGGSGILATELGHGLAARGHEVHFITYAIPFRLRLEEENVFFHEVSVSRYDLFQYPDYALALAVKMAAVAQCCGLDILHVHYAIPHATSAFLALELMRGRRPKVVTTLHGTDITLVGGDPAYYEIVKFSMEKSDALTAVSQSLRCKTREGFDLAKEIAVIPNFFVPDPAVRPRRELFASHGEKLLIHSSNYRIVKRPLDLLEIFALVREQLPAKLLLLGSGDGLTSLRSEVASRGLEEEVLFLGSSREVGSYIASADLFLLPSEQESFGLAALEAMAYGLPVIATNVGGLPELVEDGVNGFLSEVGDVESMAKGALLLLEEEELYKRFSLSAKTRAAEHFSADKVIPQYEALYRELLS